MSQRRATLTRLATSDEGTFGQIVSDSGFTAVTGELPWRDNRPNESCIPPGAYICRHRWSQKHQRNVYHVDGTDGRAEIEIHAANLMGDSSKGYTKQLLGCIALGERAVVFKAGTLPGQTKDQHGIANSRETVLAFENDMHNLDFDLLVQWAGKGA